MVILAKLLTPTAGKNLDFFYTKISFLGFNLQMPDTKLRPTSKDSAIEHHRSQFIFEYHLY